MWPWAARPDVSYSAKDFISDPQRFRRKSNHPFSIIRSAFEPGAGNLGHDAAANSAARSACGAPVSSGAARRPGCAYGADPQRVGANAQPQPRSAACGPGKYGPSISNAKPEAVVHAGGWGCAGVHAQNLGLEQVERGRAAWPPRRWPAGPARRPARPAARCGRRGGRASRRPVALPRRDRASPAGWEFRIRPHLAEHRVELVAQRRVEAARRFVEQQQRGDESSAARWSSAGAGRPRPRAGCGPRRPPGGTARASRRWRGGVPGAACAPAANARFSRSVMCGNRA